MLSMRGNILSEALDLFRRGSDLGLRNSEIWLEDADLLMEHKSYGHAYALLTFADEELIKAFIFWVLAEGIIDLDLNSAQKLFRRLDHSEKHIIIRNLIMGFALDREISEKGIEKLEKLKEQYSRLSKEIGRSKEIRRCRERLRQKAIYVDLKKGELQSPDKISKEMVVSLRDGVLRRLEFIRNLISVPEPVKKKIVEAFKEQARTILLSQDSS